MKSTRKATPSEILTANLDNNWTNTTRSLRRHLHKNTSTTTTTKSLLNQSQSSQLLKQKKSQVNLQELPLVSSAKMETRRLFLAEKSSSSIGMKENLCIVDLHLSKRTTTNQIVDQCKGGNEKARYPIGSIKRNTRGGACYVPGTFEQTYDNIFHDQEKRRLPRNESRTQFIRDNEMGGRKYNIISHAVLKDEWTANSEFQHSTNKRHEHPSHVAMIRYKH